MPVFIFVLDVAYFVIKRELRTSWISLELLLGFKVSSLWKRRKSEYLIQQYALRAAC